MPSDARWRRHATGPRPDRRAYECRTTRPVPSPPLRKYQPDISVASPHAQLPSPARSSNAPTSAMSRRCGNDGCAEPSRRRCLGKSRRRLAALVLPHATPYRIGHRLHEIGKNGAFTSRDQDVGHHAGFELLANFVGKFRHLH